MSQSDTVTLDIEGPDGADELRLPAGLIDILADDDQTAADVVGDLAMFGCAQRIHAGVHHAQGEVDEDVAALEEPTMARFEERFGVSYGEASGHQH